MPTPVAESRANANFIQQGQGAWPLPTHMAGVTTGYPIYELNYEILKLRLLGLSALLGTDTKSNLSMAHLTCDSRRSNHGDRDGNLPWAQKVKHAFCEYHLPANGAPYPANIRIIYDTYRRNLFVTPCHYDPWTDAGGTNRNPFYLLTNTPSVMFGGVPEF